MTIKICDRCGARICSDESKVTMIQIIITPKRDIHETWDVMDLCDECKSSFNEWMHHYDDHAEERKMPISRNCFEGYLTPDCNGCPDWSDDRTSIGCQIKGPISMCKSFMKVYESNERSIVHEETRETEAGT